MPPNRFPVVEISEEMILADEPMGSKEKFWCRLESDGSKWLFKHPRAEAGKMEDVAEKVVQEIADLIKVPTARVEFARFEGSRGTISKDVQAVSEALIHGNEMIAGRVTGYDLHRRRRTTDHTIERIRQAITEACKGQCEEDIRQFAGYLTLDALVGNTDRHHENWALLRRGNTREISYRLAPSFDHASSLGREMRDDRRLMLIRENRIEQYMRGGQGAVFLESDHGRTFSPLDLVEKINSTFAPDFAPWLANLEFVTPEALDGIFQRVPEGWISGPQEEFAKMFVLHAKQILLRLVK
jgi:hypothetical protein